MPWSYFNQAWVSLGFPGFPNEYGEVVDCATASSFVLAHLSRRVLSPLSFDVTSGRAPALEGRSMKSWLSRMRTVRAPSGACALLGSLLLLSLTGACTAVAPSRALDAAQPSNAAVRNIDNFNEAMRCMDRMFASLGKRDIYITTAGIPDATGLIAAGTKEMFISAVSEMSEASGAFRYVDYDPTQTDVQVLSELVGLGKNFLAPRYYVRGAITQLDSGVQSASVGGGLSLPGLNLAAQHDQVASVITVDLNVGELVTRQILPGITASNSIAVVASDNGANLGGIIGKVGLSFNVALSRSEGFSQAVRTLVDLSTIEVLGKLTHVPYWQCLQLNSTDPSFRSQARNWFDLMGSGERDTFFRNGLLSAGYLKADSGDLSDAIARYQADHDLIANGREDFDLYWRMLAANSLRPGAPIPAPAPPAQPVAAAVPTPVPAPAPAVPPGLTLATARGADPTYRVGENMSLQVQPAQDAFVYCYYQDAEGTVARIFPNRFQPDPFLQAGTSISIPPAGQRAFAINFDRANTQEHVACLAANREVGLQLPAALKRQDLEPLPVHGLNDIAAQFRALPGAQVSEATLTVNVAR
jgi:hypothetical protein